MTFSRVPHPWPALAMSASTRERLEVLNGVLFVLIGLEILTLAVTRHLAASGIAITVALIARSISTGLLLFLLRRSRQRSPHLEAASTDVIIVMT